MSNTRYISDFSAWLLAAGRARGTVELRRYHVARALGVLGDAAQVSTSALVEYLARPEWSASTRRSVRASLVTFYRWAAASGIVERSPAAALPSVLTPRGLPRPASEHAIVQAMAAGSAGSDDRAALIVEVMATMGLRRCEVCKIHTRDLLSDLGGGHALRVEGKGGHVRTVPVPPSIAARVIAANGWLFPGQIEGHLSAAYVGKLASRALPPGITPHQLRHRYGTVAYGRSGDIRAVQELLGHAKLETTAVYVAVSGQAARAAGVGAWTIAA